MKTIFSILILLLGSSWIFTPGARLHAPAGIVHTYTAAPTVRAKASSHHERRDTQRNQKKDDAYKVRVHRQRIRIRHDPLETAFCCKVESAVRIGLIASHFSNAAPLFAYYIPSLVAMRGPPAV
jgi:hypothetical protein